MKMDFYKKKINRPVSNGKKEPPANLTGGNPYIFSCKSAFFSMIRVFFELNFLVDYATQSLRNLFICTPY